jgi:hypothetical protein
MKTYYPPVGIAHILNDVTDLIKNRIKGKNLVKINISLQLNGLPHIGTIYYIASAFSLAKKINSNLNIDCKVVFHGLDNVNVAIKEQESGTKIVKEIKDIESDLIDKYLKILNIFKKINKINYEIKKYSYIQEQPIVRKTIISILQSYEKYSEILNPKNNRINIRIKCPICGSLEKEGTNIKFYTQKEYVIIEDICLKHGKYKVKLMPDNQEYIDCNTALRDVMYNIQFQHENETSNNLNILYDGSDWSGTWDSRINSETLMMLGRKVKIVRIFAPLILDQTGAKISKSIYIKDENYRKNIGDSIIFNFTDLTEFNSTIKKINLITDEWVSKPKKFFRNYTLEYIMKKMKEMKEKK